MIEFNSRLQSTLAKAAKDLKQPLTPQKMAAFFRAAEIAMKAVMRASAEGNARCQAAEKEMEPFMQILKQNEGC